MGPESGPEKTVTVIITEKEEENETPATRAGAVCDPGRPKRTPQHADLGPGQSLVSGFVLQSSSTSALLLSELSVVSEDQGVGLQHVVESVEAVRPANLWALLQGTHLGAVKVLVGAHSSQQLQLQGAALPLPPCRAGQLL